MNKRSLWQVLWDYDPNGLVVVTPELLITVVNPSFCSMFNLKEQDLLGYSLTRFFDDAQVFRTAWDENRIIPPEKKLYTTIQLYVRRLIFPIREEQVIAGIFVNLTDEWLKLQQAESMKQQVLEEVTAVINDQVLVAQHIAQLLGDTTARSSISLHRLAALVQKDVL